MSREKSSQVQTPAPSKEAALDALAIERFQNQAWKMSGQLVTVDRELSTKILYYDIAGSHEWARKLRILSEAALALFHRGDDPAPFSDTDLYRITKASLDNVGIRHWRKTALHYGELAGLFKREHIQGYASQIWPTKLAHQLYVGSFIVDQYVLERQRALLAAIGAPIPSDEFFDTLIDYARSKSVSLYTILRGGDLGDLEKEIRG